MRSLPQKTLILWILSALCIIGTFMIDPEKNMIAFIAGLVISVGLAFVGWIIKQRNEVDDDLDMPLYSENQYDDDSYSHDDNLEYEDHNFMREGIKKGALVIWIISAVFFASSITYLFTGQIRMFASGIVLSAILAYVGYRKQTKINSPGSRGNKNVRVKAHRSRTSSGKIIYVKAHKRRQPKKRK